MFGRLVSLAGGVVLGVMASQFPEFAQQYQQRLGGAVDELRGFVQSFDASAASEGLTREQALDTYAATDDRFLTRRGQDVGAIIARYDRLETQLDALENANIVTRVTDLAAYYDPDIAERALEAYKPAVPVTPEGFAYAGTGLILGYGVLASLGWAGKRGIRRRRSRKNGLSGV